MSRVFRQQVRTIRDGEAVTAGVANRPVLDLAGNVTVLRETLEQMRVGSSLVLRSQRVDPAAAAGRPVYLDGATGTWKPAVASLVSSGVDAGSWQFGPDSYVGGIVYSRVGRTGDILINGAMTLPAAWATTAFDGAYRPGPVYLSRATPGKLSTSGGLTVRVGVAYAGSNGSYTLVVQPSTREGMATHTHLRMELISDPAGLPNWSPEETEGETLLGELEAEGPYPDFRHDVAAPDSARPGWLPVRHPLLAGVPIPTGAKFWYNIGAHSALAAVWPPSPAYFASSAVVTVDGIIAGTDRVVSNAHGIWWMDNRWGRAPWSVNYRPYYTSSSSSSSSSPDPIAPLTLRRPDVVLWFNSIFTQTEAAFLTSLESPDGSLVVGEPSGGVATLSNNSGYAELAALPAAFYPAYGGVETERFGRMVAKRIAGPSESVSDVTALPCVQLHVSGATALYPVRVARAAQPGQSLYMRVRVRALHDGTSAFSIPALLQTYVTAAAVAPEGLQAPTAVTAAPAWDASAYSIAVSGGTYVDIESAPYLVPGSIGDVLNIAIRSQGLTGDNGQMSVFLAGVWFTFYSA